MRAVFKFSPVLLDVWFLRGWFWFGLLLPCLTKGIEIFISYFFGCVVQQAESQFPDQGLNSCPLQWKYRVLTTGLPGKS